jgi:uncharacterized membrane protein
MKRLFLVGPSGTFETLDIPVAIDSLATGFIVGVVFGILFWECLKKALGNS